MKPSFLPYLRVTALTFCFMGSAVPAACFAAIDIAGGPPTAPVDITAYLLADQDLNFTGGNFVVRLPEAGVGVTPANAVDPRLSDLGSTGYSSATNPTISYSGLISGDGVLTVQSAFNAVRPAYGQRFTGGALVFTNFGTQTWGVQGIPSGGRNASALIIDPNATVEFWFPGELDRQVDGVPRGFAFPASTTVSRNITNNGFMFSTAKNTWGSITGSGINSFAYFGGDDGQLGATASFYSGQSFHTANGARWGGNSLLEDQPGGDPTTLVTRGLTVFEPSGAMSLLSSAYNPATPVKTVSQNMYNWSINVQLWANGIHRFTGLFLPTTASKSFLELSPVADAVKGVYSYNGGGMAFGRVINLNNRATLLMGDGREVITNSDGVTTNVWLQGNPFNTLLSTSNFVSAYPGLDAQALAYAYSGSYRINHNFNAEVDSKAGIIKGIRGNYWTNLYILDPTVYNPAAKQVNRAVVTTTVFFGGLTRIDKNAVLQLGDGTLGNNSTKLLSFSDGASVSFPYSDSSGNGMLITKGNDGLLPKKSASMSDSVLFEIRNNGTLIVNNTPGALSASTAGASAAVAAWVAANQLDGITGGGSLEQMGRLPLTLGAVNGNPNSFTGGTIIHPNASLVVASDSALGAAEVGKPNSGRVINNGSLQAAPGQRRITVPGDYVQVLTP